ncbi:MAG: hypothetical protein V3V72_13410 [Ignavibacteriaceae bacterium]
MEDLQLELEELQSQGFYLGECQCCGDGEVEYLLHDQDDDHVGYVLMSNGQRYGEEAGTIHSINY